MATYEKMVLLSEAEYLNLKNFKYLPHEVDDESGYDDYGDDDGDDGDDGGDVSGYEEYVTEDEDPGRLRRAPTEDSGRQTPEERHIETPSEDSSRLRWVQRQQEVESRHSTPAHHSRHSTPIAAPGGSTISDDENRRRVEGVRTQLMAVVGAIKESLPAPPPLEVIEGLRPDEVRAMEQVERLSILRRDTPEDWRHKVVQIMNRSKDRSQKTLINKKRRKHFIKMAGIVRRNKLRHGKIANILARHMQAKLQGNWNDALPEKIQPELSEAERSELETRLDNLPDDLSAAIRHIGREAIIQNYEEHGYNIPDIAGEIELETFITDEDIQRFVDEEEASMRAVHEYDEYLRLEEEQRENARQEAEEDAQYEQYVEDQERQRHAAEQPDERDEIEQKRAEKARRFAQQADEARWEEERREEAQRRAEEEEQRRLEEEAQRDNEDTSAAEDSSVQVDSAAEESFADREYNLSEIPANLEYNARQLLNQLMMRDILIGRNFYPHADDDRQTQVNIDVPTFLHLAAGTIRFDDKKLRAGPRTLAAIAL